MRLSMSVFALVSCVAVAAQAQLGGLGPMPGEERFSEMSGAGSNSAGAGLGVAGIDEDFFLQVTIKTELNLGPVGVGFAIPLNLRVMDRDPQNTEDFYGIVRREDWDETSEYLRAIRYVRLGHKRDDFYLRVGDLAADIGHGTIMARYLNNMDVNTRRLGAQFDVNTNYGGIETMVGDVGSLMSDDSSSSRVVGLRGYIKPLALLDPEGLLNIFAVGASWVSDMNAPYTYEVDESGAVLIESGKFVVDRSDALTIYGVDLEVELLHTPILDLVPYTDLNFIQGGGSGWHAGILATAKMPIGLDLKIPVRFEYRRFAGDYIPAYFGPFYEIERYAFGFGGSQLPKAQFIKEMSSEDAEEGLNGYYGDLAFDFAGIFQVGAYYEDYEGADPNLAVFLNVPALEIAQFKAYYERHHIKGAEDVFVFDNRSFAVAQAQYELFPYVFAVARLSRRWQLDPEKAKYVAVDDYNVGVEASFDF